MSLSRLLILFCALAAGCAERAAVVPTSQAKEERQKLKDRDEMMELWEKWNLKLLNFKFHLDSALRFQLTLPEEAKKSNDMAHKIGEEIDRLDALSRDKYGVPCEQLPRLLKP